MVESLYIRMGASHSERTLLRESLHQNSHGLTLTLMLEVLLMLMGVLRPKREYAMEGIWRKMLGLGLI